MSVNTRWSIVWSLAYVVFVAVALLVIHNAACFSWSTARPPVGKAHRASELSGEEISTARGRARLWFLVAAAATVGADARVVVAGKARSVGSKERGRAA